GAGEQGGRVLYSGPVDALERVDESVTGRYLFGPGIALDRQRYEPSSWLCLRHVTRHNLNDVDAEFPLRALTAVTGVSGSGKSTLVTQVLAGVVGDWLGDEPGVADDAELEIDDREQGVAAGVQALGLEAFDRLVSVDQKPIGRTPRSNLATYTGMFDAVRKLYASTDEAQRRGYAPGRFSFNVPGGRCETCNGEGFVAVELLFLPGTYAPCPTCHGSRYEPDTLEIRVRGKSIADVLAMTVDEAALFLADVPAAVRSLETLRQVGLGYLRLGQPATELSGGEAQRIKLATELQRGRRGHALYLLDEPTTGLHPSGVELLLHQLHRLVDAGNTVVVVEHDLDVIAAADWIIDLGPGAGDQGGTIVATGPPERVARSARSRTAPYLAERLPTSTARRPAVRRRRAKRA
ncbi:MAG: ABC transporter, partial [Gaiellaceae bacterium]